MEPDLDQLRLQQLLQPFNNQTGVMSTNSAIPMINSIPMINTGMIDQNLQNTDLVQQIIAENQARANPFVRPNMLDIAGRVVPGGITEVDLMEENQLPYSGVGDMRYTTPRTIEDQNKVLGQTFTEQEPSGIEKLFKLLIPGNLFATLLSGILPKESPQMKAAKSFYENQYGLTPGGSVASGIMAGYNPVSGGLLNMLTGGAYGSPPNIGLQRAYQQRINMIKNTLAKKYADGDYSGTQLDEKLAELQKLKTAEQMAMEKPTIDKARKTNRDVYREADRQGFTGPGGGFSTSGREGAFSSSNPSGRGRQDF
jgi:hypothetical protein